MIRHGWQNRSSQLWKDGPWSPDLILVEDNGEMWAEIQIGVPRSTPVFPTEIKAKQEARMIALWAAENLMNWDLSGGLREVQK